jgi:uncharacterized protein (DUF1684 family)
MIIGSFKTFTTLYSIKDVTSMKRVAPFQIIFILSFFLSHAYAQSDSVAAMSEIKIFQQELDKEYRDPVKSPLGKNAKKFKGHEFFPINLKFRVVAKLKVTSNSPFFMMKTTSVRLDEERIYGILEFTLEGKQFQLPVYQSSNLLKTQEYKDYLFLPFTDSTNGFETYHGGRYIDLRIPKGEEIIIDFNKAYNPYCAYASGFSCPIVPKENHIDIRISAGIEYHEKK